MNTRINLFILLGVIFLATVLPGTAFAKEASKSDYTIPAELTPVSKWKNG